MEVCYFFFIIILVSVNIANSKTSKELSEFECEFPDHKVDYQILKI